MAVFHAKEGARTGVIFATFGGLKARAVMFVVYSHVLSVLHVPQGIMLPLSFACIQVPPYAVMYYRYVYHLYHRPGMLVALYS